MDVRHLRQVIEIRRVGSFARAAQALGMSQPALSRSIARLEDELGVSLFDRTGGATRPTTFGQYVAERGKDVLDQVDAIERDVRRLFSGQAGRLALGIAPGATDWFERNLLGALVARYPDLALTVYRERASFLADLLTRRELDLVIAQDEAVPGRPDLVRAALLRIEVACVVRAGHPAVAFETPISLERLLAFPFALPAVTVDLMRWLPDRMTPEQQDNLRAYSAQDYGLLTQICLHTDAVMIAPHYLVEALLAAGRLHRLSVQMSGESLACLATNTEGRHSSVIREVVKMICESWPGGVAQV